MGREKADSQGRIETLEQENHQLAARLERIAALATSSQPAAEKEALRDMPAPQIRRNRR